MPRPGQGIFLPFFFIVFRTRLIMERMHDICASEGGEEEYCINGSIAD